jgi:hypothetical protein
MDLRYERKGRNTLAIATPSMHKRAALLFDKVFLVEYQTGPEEVKEEMAPRTRFDWLINRATLVPNMPLRPLNTEEQGELFRALGEFAEAIGKISAQYADYDLVPMYTGDATSIPDGTTLAYQAAFRTIPEVLEEEAAWDQIVEFRNDPDATTKYRALRTWLRDGLSARSVAEAEDRIAEKLRDYEAALEKHGLKTMQGCLTMLYDAQFLAQAGAVSGTAWGVFGPVGAALAAGLYVAGKVLLQLSERRVEMIDALRQNHSEVAVIYEAKRLAGSGEGANKGAS